MPTDRAVCRELTKRFEEIVVAPLSALAARFSDPARGEITLVLAASTPSVVDAAEPDALSAVRELVEAGVTRRQAAEVVSRLTGTPRNALYRGSL
jgi:16S rRNA (cytidine1402-2'-O)-methyltransferase